MASRGPVFSLVLLLCGCGEKFPEAWQELGLPTEHLVSAGTQEYGSSKGNEVIAVYSAEVGLAELVAAWDAALSAKGFAQLCAVDHGDGSLSRGYGSLPQQRYRLAASPVGEVAHELHLLKVPEHVPDEEVCPKIE